MKVTIVASGPLHVDPLKNFRRGVSQALEETATYGLGIIKARTPVRTGHLKNSWYSKFSSWNEFYYSNTAKYSPFVEAKVLMAARSRPEISRYLTRALNKNIESEMN